MIGTGLGQWYGSYMFQVLSGGSGRTGADIVRMITYQSAAGAAVREDAIGTPHACGMQPVRDPRILVIQRMMLDAVDRYDDVQGTFDIAFSNNGQQDTVDFESSPKQRSSFVRVQSRDGRVIERVANGASGMTLYPQQSSFRRTRLIASATPEGPRHYLNSQCEPVFVHRQDPAGADGASDVISPANYAFWLSTSDSEIVGHERLLGRDVTVIRGRHDAYLRAKLNAATFRMWVDDATGVLLKLQGTTPDGRSAYSIDVRGIRFDQELDLKPSLAAPSGWKALSAN